MFEDRKDEFFNIDNVNGFRLYEVILASRSDFIYKIYKEKECIKKWVSSEDLHSMELEECLDSVTYGEFLDYIDEYKLKHPTSNNSLPKAPKYGNTPKASSVSYGGSYYSGGYHGGYSGYYTPKPEVLDQAKVDELSKSDTLVFHLTDRSTTMLAQMYEGKDWDVVHSRLNTPTTKALIDNHSKIVCLGHGHGGGLMGMFGTEVRENFKGKQLFIIWCNADRYFDDGNLGQGQFITGNMPSEVWECRAAGCGAISTQLMLDNITYWSKLCSDVTEQCLNGDVRGGVDYIRREYIKAYGDHPVTHYNAVRTMVHGDSYEQAEQEVRAIEDELGIHPNWAKYNGGGGYGVHTSSNDNTDALDNPELKRGLAMTLNRVKNIINTNNSFDLKSVGQGDENFYTYFGNLVIDELHKLYPEKTFTLEDTTIKW